jgi:hypothetical protein
MKKKLLEEVMAAGEFRKKCHAIYGMNNGKITIKSYALFVMDVLAHKTGYNNPRWKNEEGKNSWWSIRRDINEGKYTWDIQVEFYSRVDVKQLKYQETYTTHFYTRVMDIWGDSLQKYRERVPEKVRIKEINRLSAIW